MAFRTTQSSRGLLTIGVLAASLSLAACGGAGSDSEAARERQLEEYAARYGANVDVDVDENGEVRSVAMGGVNGAVGGMNLAVPDGFPDDVALYPDLNIVATSQIPGGGFMLQGLTPDASEAVQAYYADEMTGAGWTNNTRPGGLPTMTAMTFEKAGRVANVNLIAGDNVMVQMTVMPGG